MEQVDEVSPFTPILRPGTELFRIEVYLTTDISNHVILNARGKALDVKVSTGRVTSTNPPHQGCSLDIIRGKPLPGGGYGAYYMNFYGAVVGASITAVFEIDGLINGDEFAVYTSTIADTIDKIVVNRYLKPAPNEETIYTVLNVPSRNHIFRLAW